MSAVLLTIEQCLRNQGPFAPADETWKDRIVSHLCVIALCGAVYGACMGSFGVLSADGWKQIFLSAVKVPFLFLVTFLLCLPSFYVMNALSGLRGDFGRVSGALLGFQSVAAVVLAALGPITLLMNWTSGFYTFIKLWNGLIFAVASVAGHLRMAAHYRTLARSNARHAVLLRVWVVLYAFVGIQMAWVLRPFVGSPGMSFQIFREEAWGNAYLEIARLFLDLVRTML